MATVSERPPPAAASQLHHQPKVPTQATNHLPPPTGLSSLQPPSALSLVVSLLHLLDYQASKYHLPVSAKLFASGKDKVKIFEHVAFFLLDTYNHDEATEKFASLWPAYEPLQSKELRNAIFKWLSDLKRLNVLHTSLLRRSTLDDCHGERYEELLLALAAMVVKDQVDKGRFGDAVKHCAAYQEVCKARGSRTRMALLAFAYTVSLDGKLEKRRELKERYEGLEGVLRERDAEMMGAEAEMGEMPEDGELWRRREVENKWRRNWLGDERILEALVKNGRGDEGDRLFEVGFEKAIKRRGRVGAAAGGIAWEINKGLEQQEKRLQILRGVLEQFKGEGDLKGRERDRQSKRLSAIMLQEKAKGLGIQFDKHQKIKIGSQSGASLKNFENPFSDLLDSLRADLAHLRPQSDQPSYPKEEEEPLRRPVELSESAAKLTELSLSPLKSDATYRAETLLGNKRIDRRRWDPQETFTNPNTTSTRTLDDVPSLQPTTREPRLPQPPAFLRNESAETQSTVSSTSSRSRPYSARSLNKSPYLEPSTPPSQRSRPDYKPSPKDIWEEKRRISSAYKSSNNLHDTFTSTSTDDPLLAAATRPQRIPPRRPARTPPPPRHRTSDSENESLSEVETPYIPRRRRLLIPTVTATTVTATTVPLASPFPTRKDSNPSTRFSLHISSPHRSSPDSDTEMTDSLLLADHVLAALKRDRNLDSAVKKEREPSPGTDADGDWEMSSDFGGSEGEGTPRRGGGRDGMQRGGGGFRTPSPQRMRAPTPKEQLLMSEDPSRVFRSRPKVANSPVFGSPVKGWGEVPEEMI
ncbi:hypothetical protein BJ508DRAFT_59555 [Ascobolus immersus RN42]|uniref:HAUS augmin-like complex subunit 6 N-terminal domain-containing protein n=1 Tax=Ascobolus immersus RN42 TaxID=1160509 RepID=A0A3N4INV7_ASCIM|nr:hypothetical protein BJ508DRAFT_59555 [Ascobolus immersus RN42]